MNEFYKVVVGICAYTHIYIQYTFSDTISQPVQYLPLVVNLENYTL